MSACSNDTPGSKDAGRTLLTKFSVNGFDAQIDATNRIIDLVVPSIWDLTQVKPYFSTNNGTLMQGDRVLQSGFSTIDITTDSIVSVVNNDTRFDYTIRLRNTGLPIVEISTPGEKEVTSKTDWTEGATISIHLPDGTLDYSGTTSIRGRGNSTWGYPKKPYALKLDKKAEILSMPKHKRWILLANWKDRTLLRNDAAFWLSRQTCLAYTVRGQFVEVVMNGKFAGNYYLCEQIKIDKNRVNVTEMDGKETDPEKITGGYLMELDTYFDETFQFKSQLFNLPFIIKEPDEDALSNEAFVYMKNYVNQLETILQDETRIRNHEYEDLFDVDSSIDWFFIHELATNTEAYSSYPWPGPHSCYMYKDRDGKLFSGPVWDFDYHGFTPMYENKWVCRNALYYKALIKDERYYLRMQIRWKLLKDKFAELPAYIDQQAEHIRASEGINIALWPIDNAENGDETMSFQQAIDRMKATFQAKWNWMDANLSNFK